MQDRANSDRDLVTALCATRLHLEIFKIPSV